MDSIDRETGEIVALRTPMPAPVAAAIIAVGKQVKRLGADSKNEHGRYNYVSVDKFYEQVGALMAEAGLALLIDETATEVRASDKTGNPWLFAHYELTFMHESGVLGPSMRRSCALPINGPQTFGAAQSYIEKQFLRQVFKVPTGDRDADETPQSDDAPGKPTEARTAQGNASGARTAATRPQAAPAPSPAKEAATKRWKELRDEIDAAMTVTDVQTLDGCLAWAACHNAIAGVDGEEVAKNAMETLRTRIAKRIEMLTPSAEYQA
jgi:hypothetical protein